MPHDYDIGLRLASLGIEKRHITPTNNARPELNQFRHEINILPLQWFDGGSDDDAEAVDGRCNRRSGRRSVTRT